MMVPIHINYSLTSTLKTLVSILFKINIIFNYLMLNTFYILNIYIYIYKYIYIYIYI